MHYLFNEIYLCLLIFFGKFWGHTIVIHTNTEYLSQVLKKLFKVLVTLDLILPHNTCGTIEFDKQAIFS